MQTDPTEHNFIHPENPEVLPDVPVQQPETSPSERAKLDAALEHAREELKKMKDSESQEGQEITPSEKEIDGIHIAALNEVIAGNKDVLTQSQNPEFDPNPKKLEALLKDPNLTPHVLGDDDPHDIIAGFYPDKTPKDKE